mgnify:CR=1 FL=1
MPNITKSFKDTFGFILAKSIDLWWTTTINLLDREIFPVETRILCTNNAIVQPLGHTKSAKAPPREWHGSQMPCTCPQGGELSTSAVYFCNFPSTWIIFKKFADWKI